MLKQIIIVVLSLSVLSCNGTNARQEQGVTKEMLLKDIDAYRDGIMLHNVGPFRYITMEDFIKQTEQIEAERPFGYA